MKLKLLIAIFALATVQAFAFEGTITQHIKKYNGGDDVKITWYISRNDCRVDIDVLNKEETISSVLLLGGGTGSLRTYFPKATGGEDYYYDVNLAAVKGSTPDLSVTPTTETRVIQGFKCEKWVVASAGTIYEVWITREIDFDALAYREYFKSGVEIQALAQQGVKGFPMLTESKSGNNAATVDKVTAQVLAKETFTMPAKYKPFVPKPLAPSGK